jgi:DNA polymerase-3 subunit delta
MKINFQQFNLSLCKQSFPIFCISGNEYQLSQEIIQMITTFYTAENFVCHYRTILQEELGHHVLNEIKTGALFEPKRLFIIEIENLRIIKAMEQALINFCEKQQKNIILIVKLPSLDKSHQHSAWHKAIDKFGIHITLWPLNEKQFQQWLQKHVQAKKLHLSAKAFAALAILTEGNVLRAYQEIEKLKLQYGEQCIEENNIINAVGQMQEYNLFALAESCLKGDSVRLQRQLQALRNDEIEPLILLGTLAYDLRHVLLFHEKQQAKQPSNNFRDQKYMLALKREPNLNFWWQMLAFAHELDRMIKSSLYSKEVLWDHIEQWALKVAGNVAGPLG